MLVENHLGFYSHCEDKGRYCKIKLEVIQGLGQRSSITLKNQSVTKAGMEAKSIIADYYRQERTEARPWE